MSHAHVLLSAYQCAPGRGSVSQIGWEWYSRLSLETTVTLLTHVRNRDALTQAGAPLPGSKIIYIDTEWFAGPLHRLATTLFRRSEHAVFLMSSLDYFVYDAAALRRLRGKAADYGIIHQVTPVSPLAVTRLHKLNLPLVMGPLNGGLTTPGGFRQTLRKDSQWFYHVRSVGRLFDLFAGCYRRAARILVATAATERSLPKRVKTERLIENGVDLDLFHGGELPAASPEFPLRILFAGRLIPAKGVDMLFAAAAQVRSKIPLRITIAGDGALLTELQQQVHRLGLQDVVVFVGHQNQAQIAALMRESHLFCLPSIRESGGAVIVEAMASGLPILGVAHGGPGELIDEDVGRALAPETPEAVIEGLAAALHDLYRDPEDWKQRGRNGRKRAETTFGWPGRVRRVMSLYGEVIEEWNGAEASGRLHQHGAKCSSTQHIS